MLSNGAVPCLALLAAVIVAAPTAAGPAPAWTLDDALAAFQQGSPELDEARARAASARADVTQAGLGPNPELSLTVGNVPLVPNLGAGGNGPGLGRNLVTSVGLSQTLELGGKRRKRVASARSRVAGASAGVDDALRLARFEVERAFWAALGARAKRELAEVIHGRYAETARISQARFAADDISGADLDKIVLEGARQENDVADARGAEAVALEELLRLVGPAAPAKVSLQGELEPPPAPAPDPAALLHRAREARPDVRVARERVETAHRELALAEAQAVPDLTLGIGYAHSQAVVAGDNPDTLSFTVGLPLPFRNRNQGEVEKARVELAAAGRALEAASARAGREVREALARLAAAEEKHHRHVGGVLQRSQRALETAEKAYRQGATSLLALLEAQRTFIQLREESLDTLVELRSARLEVERSAGPALSLPHAPEHG